MEEEGLEGRLSLSGTTIMISTIFERLDAWKIGLGTRFLLEILLSNFSTTKRRLDEYRTLHRHTINFPARRIPTPSNWEYVY